MEPLRPEVSVVLIPEGHEHLACAAEVAVVHHEVEVTEVRSRGSG